MEQVEDACILRVVNTVPYRSVLVVVRVRGLQAHKVHIGRGIAVDHRLVLAVQEEGCVVVLVANVHLQSGES